MAEFGGSDDKKEVANGPRPPETRRGFLIKPQIRTTQEPEGMAKMSKAKFFSKRLAATVVAGVAGPVGAAIATDSAAKWSQLQETDRLAEICRGVTHDRETWRTHGTKIDVPVNHEIGGG